VLLLHHVLALRHLVVLVLLLQLVLAIVGRRCSIEMSIQSDFGRHVLLESRRLLLLQADQLGGLDVAEEPSVELALSPFLHGLGKHVAVGVGRRLCGLYL